MFNRRYTDLSDDEAAIVSEEAHRRNEIHPVRQIKRWFLKPNDQ
jgi:hypothetical protein